MTKWLIKTSLLALLLTSCSAQWHLKTAIKKDPLILKKDTVVVVDTLVTAPVTVRDTVTLSNRDTVIITKDKLTVKLVKSFDTIAIEAECASDTIIRTIEVPYEKVVYVQQKTLKQKIQTWALYLVVAFIGFKFIQRAADKFFDA
jgi:hypothetical protein